MLGEQLFGSYRPGNSTVHKSPLLLKMLVILGASLLLLFTTQGWVAVTCCFAALLLGKTAGISLNSWAKTLKPLSPLLTILSFYYLVIEDINLGVDVIFTMVAMVLLSRILLVTTPIPRLIDGFVRLCKPLRSLGFSPEKIGLSIALMIRSIPVIMNEYSSIKQAHEARGLKTWPHKLLIPLVVATVSYANETGDALAARGLDQL